MESFLEIVFIFFGSLIILYMFVVIVSYCIMLVLALMQLRRQYQLNKQEIDEEYIDGTYTKPVSIIVPAFNEEAGIIDSVHSLLSLHYPQTEIIVINDGSTDGTQQKMLMHFQMKQVQKVVRQQLTTKPIKGIYQSKVHPNLWLIEKENGGKADALNVGINFAKYPYFCSVDGDSILEDASLLRVMKPIILSGEEVIAAGGTIQIANGHDVQLGSVFQTNLSNNLLVVMQVVEYLRAFLMGRIALSKMNLVLIISGAFGVFSKKWVIDAGGYSTQMIGEDAELVIKLHRLIKERKAHKRIVFVPDPVCWTEAPNNFSTLRKQRRRWHQGLIESLWKHRKMTLNPQYGVIGMVSFPYFWIECISPIIELGGYIYVLLAFFMGNIYHEYALLLFILLVFYGSILSVTSVLLEAWSVNAYPKIRDVFRLLFVSLSESFWYRPLTLLWRLEGIIMFLRKRHDWGEMQRVGLSRKELSS